MIQNNQIGHVGKSVKTVYHIVAQYTVGSGQYNEKLLRIETSFSGRGRNKVKYVVAGRKEGKLFLYEFKHYDNAVDTYNGISF